MKSKTKINKQARRKFNPELVETIFLAKKHEKWLEVASMLSRPKRLQISVNLDKIDRESKENETIVIPGKVLGVGELSKKIKVVAFSFSKSALDKIKKGRAEFKYLKEEIKENPKAEKIKILS